MQNTETPQKDKSIKRAIFSLVRNILGNRVTNVYFISGMCNNCSVFSGIKLPEGFKKHYIEWIIPKGDETLEEYARMMAKPIDQSKPFVLIGYSFGGNIIQEMNKFLCPEKNIVISSMTTQKEIPTLFEVARSIHFAEHVPDRLLAATEFITKVFTKFIYEMPTDKVAKYMIYTEPVYLKWAIYQITNWKPVEQCRNIYHIHGTKDQIFPYEQMSDEVYTVKGGDHLMVMERAKEVSDIIGYILTKK